MQVVAINPNDAVNYPDDSFDNMKARAADKSFNFPYLHDESQEVARAYDAACTPDIFVFDQERTLIYNGRIDDNWKVELEARAWNGVEPDDPMAPLRRDDYIQLTLSRFF